MDYAGQDGGGFIMTVVLGCVGAVVGGYIAFTQLLREAWVALTAFNSQAALWWR